MKIAVAERIVRPRPSLPENEFWKQAGVIDDEFKEHFDDAVRVPRGKRIEGVSGSEWRRVLRRKKFLHGRREI